MNLALGRDQHVTHHAQTLDIRVERTQTVRQLFGQHRDHPAWEIHAGGTVVGIDVNGATRVHIVADVGNRYQQTPALGATDFGRLAVNGIIKVAGVFTVYRHQRHVGQVDTALFIDSAHGIGQAAGQSHGLFAEFVGHAVLSHCNINLHTGIVNLAQHFLDPAHRLAK